MVYLNGTLLFVGGVAMVQADSDWRLGWPLLVTLTGWGVTALGLFRMIAPDSPQATEGLLTNFVFLLLLMLGVALCVRGYGRAGDGRR